jgi:hypothetical protein
MEKAVIIAAENSEKGIDAEYAWLRQKFPGHRMRSQALVKSNGKAYDVIEITTSTKETKRFYFDITGFFGK